MKATQLWTNSEKSDDDFDAIQPIGNTSGSSSPSREDIYTPEPDIDVEMLD